MEEKTGNTGKMFITGIERKPLLEGGGCNPDIIGGGKALHYLHLSICARDSGKQADKSGSEPARLR